MADEPNPAGGAPAPPPSDAGSPPPAGAPGAPEVLIGGEAKGSNPPGEGEGKQGQTAKDAPPAAPEKYEFKLPDGVQMDTALLAKVEPILKGKAFSQEEAQQLVDFYTETRTAEVKAQQEAWVNQVNGWAESVRKDPEIGGQNFDATIVAAQQAVAAHGTPGLKEMLAQTGMGSHPEVVRFFAKIGKAMAEDTFHKGGAAGEGPGSIALKFYPGMNP